MNATKPDICLQGITLREYFTGLAMQAMLTKDILTREQLAQWAVEMADELIKALNQE